MGKNSKISLCLKTDNKKFVIFAARSLQMLIKKGGGTGPVKPQQPLQFIEEGANSNSNESQKIDKSNQIFKNNTYKISSALAGEIFF